MKSLNEIIKENKEANDIHTTYCVYDKNKQLYHIGVL